MRTRIFFKKIKTNEIEVGLHERMDIENRLTKLNKKQLYQHAWQLLRNSLKKVKFQDKHKKTTSFKDI
jgi:hypothetical protein